MRNFARNVLTHPEEISRQSRSASGLVQMPEQPGAGVSPIALGGCAGNAKHLGRLLQGAAREEAKFHDLRLLRMLLFQFFQGIVQRYKVHALVIRTLSEFRQVDAFVTASPFLGPAAAGAVYENS